MHNGQGFWASDEVMKKYVEFICQQIRTDCGAAVRKGDGFPMKGSYVPVKLIITEKMISYMEMKITCLGHTKAFVFYMSRQKSPAKILHELQKKIDEMVGTIIDENGMDRDEIWGTYHPLRNLKLPK